MRITTRPIEPGDAPALADLLRINRAAFAPFEPVRGDDYYTRAGQADAIRVALDGHAAGTTVAHVIVADGRLAGRITMNNVVRGVFQSASLGYWVDAARHGRGIATAAVGALIRVAFTEMGLHRLEAGTLLHNVASQRVLERNGFVRFGVAEKYLRIAGRWQDHALYQLIDPADG
jgi:ribosomal-protein-alanine N-acetyltransferase